MIKFKKNEKVLKKGAVNKYTFWSISKPGYLYLTNERLIFESNKFSTKNIYLAIPLKEIQSYGLAITLQFFLFLPIPRSIKISTENGTTYTFIVTTRKDWILQIGNALDNLSDENTIDQSPHVKPSTTVQQIQPIVKDAILDSKIIDENNQQVVEDTLLDKNIDENGYIEDNLEDDVPKVRLKKEKESEVKVLESTEESDDEYEYIEDDEYDKPVPKVKSSQKNNRPRKQNKKVTIAIVAGIAILIIAIASNSDFFLEIGNNKINEIEDSNANHVNNDTPAINDTNKPQTNVPPSNEALLNQPTITYAEGFEQSIVNFINSDLEIVNFLNKPIEDYIDFAGLDGVNNSVNSIYQDLYFEMSPNYIIVKNKLIDAIYFQRMTLYAEQDAMQSMDYLGSVGGYNYYGAQVQLEDGTTQILSLQFYDGFSTNIIYGNYEYFLDANSNIISYDFKADLDYAKFDSIVDFSTAIFYADNSAELYIGQGNGEYQKFAGTYAEDGMTVSFYQEIGLPITFSLASDGTLTGTGGFFESSPNVFVSTKE